MKLYIAVMIGGGIGAVFRFLVGQAVPSAPWTTMGINWMGCLVLGFFLTWAAKRVPEVVRIGVGTGVVGGFTTFSTFSVETMAGLQAGRVGETVAYFVLSLVGGVLLALVGVRMARRSAKA